MRIKSIRIENLRSCKDQAISLANYTTLVGANGSGKSTVLCALNIFFRESSESPLNLLELQAEDFYNQDTSSPIRITVTFVGLSDEAEEDFKDYHRQNELVVTAIGTFNADTGRAQVTQHGQRRVMKEFSSFFEAVKAGTQVGELRTVYESLRTGHDLPAATTKPAMTDALRSFEESHPDLTELMESPDNFYGFSKGENRLAKHVQWVFVPAVKDPAEEQTENKDTALGKLLGRTVRARTTFKEEVKRIRDEARSSYDAMLAQQQGALTEVSRSLTDRLAVLTHSGAGLTVRWEQDPDKSVKIEDPSARVDAHEGNFTGNLARMGHGLQRAYLLALLQELSSAGAVGPTLILGIEEPELYQHPPQARQMMKALQALTEQNSQIVITTHNPVFIDGLTFEGVRLVRKDDAHQAVVSAVPLSRLSELLAEARGEAVPLPTGARAKIHQCLQPSLNEIFFSPRLVLVEGREDIAYILTYMNLLGYMDALRKIGCNLVAADRKSALQIPLAIASELDIPTFLVFDADTHRDGNREQHTKDNLSLLRLGKVVDPVPWPAETYWSDHVVMWRTEIGREVAADFSPEHYTRVKNEVELAFGQVGGLEKNPLFVAELLQKLSEQEMRSANLIRLCEAICSFCGISTQ